jgi:hypothetical protein
VLNNPLFSQPPVFGAYLYDAVYQYGIALNKTLSRNETPTGEAIFQKMRDISFHSKLC